MHPLVALSFMLALGCTPTSGEIRGPGVDSYNDEDTDSDTQTDTDTNASGVPACEGHSPEGTDWEITALGMTTDDYIEGGSGWSGNFVIVDLEMTNTSNSEQTIYWGRRLEDGSGRLYQDEAGPCLQLDTTYGGDDTCMSTPDLNPGETELGVIVFDVNDLDDTPFSLRVYASTAVFDEDDYSCASTLSSD